jgi:uncharacterized Tic20 family protein
VSLKYKPNDHTAAYAAAFFIANLLFVGVFFLALLVLFFLRYKKASPITQSHLKQALFASSFTTFIFIDINILIWFTGGYATLTSLLALEGYFMLIVPLFLIIGILAFVKAVTGKNFKYPLIGRMVKVVDDATHEKTGLDK